MTTFGVMCCKCGTKTAVTSEEPPNFCAMCGSKEIVMQGEVPVDRQDEQPVRAQLLEALNPSGHFAFGFGGAPIEEERVSNSDSGNDVSLDYEHTEGK